MEQKIKPGLLQFWMTTFFILSWPSSFWGFHVVFVFPAVNPNLRWCCRGRPCTSCWRGAFWSLSCAKGGLEQSEAFRMAKLCKTQFMTCLYMLFIDIDSFCIILHHGDIFWIILVAICSNERCFRQSISIYDGLGGRRGSKVLVLKWNQGWASTLLGLV